MSQLRSLTPSSRFSGPRRALRACSNLSAFWRCSARKAALKKKSKVRRTTHRGVLSPQLTLLPRKKPFKFKPWVIGYARPSFRPPLKRLHGGLFLMGPKTNLSLAPLFAPRAVPRYPLSPVQFVLACHRQAYAIVGMPHRWGPQRGMLLNRWVEAPSYVYAFSLQARVLWLAAHLKGLGALNVPKNLSWPKGPSLKDLYGYIKLNPNEGYWMYRLLLQIIKKWRRWARFPWNYLIGRNVWEQQKLVKAYTRNLRYHQRAHPSPLDQAWPARLLPLRFKLAESPITRLSVGWLTLTREPLAPRQPKLAKLTPALKTLLSLFR